MYVGDNDGCRDNAAVVLALEVVCRPLHAQLPFLRGHLASPTKFVAEGRLDEVRTVNTRHSSTHPVSTGI
jgi:hypothetical protein